MRKKKFLNGTGLGSESESATKSSSAPSGTATAVVELDDDSLASVAGGRYLSGTPVMPPIFELASVVALSSGSVTYYLHLVGDCTAPVARSVLEPLCGQDVSAQTILAYLATAGLQPTNADQFISAWDG